jgi:hypothetical protein
VPYLTARMPPRLADARRFASPARHTCRTSAARVATATVGL